MNWGILLGYLIFTINACFMVYSIANSNAHMKLDGYCYDSRNMESCVINCNCKWCNERCIYAAELCHGNKTLNLIFEKFAVVAPECYNGDMPYIYAYIIITCLGTLYIAVTITFANYDGIIACIRDYINSRATKKTYAYAA
jgi:hypothetical protein